MTVTKEQAVLAGLHEHTLFHFAPDGECCVPRREVKWRANGMCKTWGSPARRGEFKLPIKRGLGEHDYLTHLNCDDFHLAIECPLRIRED